MQKFIEYLTDQFEAGKNDIAKLEADGRKDDADFAKVRTNIYDVCRTVTKALADRPGAGPEAVKSQLERFNKEWNAALNQAREHDDIRNTVIGEIKLEALDDVIAHFPEEER